MLDVKKHPVTSFRCGSRCSVLRTRENMPLGLGAPFLSTHPRVFGLRNVRPSGHALSGKFVPGRRPAIASESCR